MPRSLQTVSRRLLPSTPSAAPSFEGVSARSNHCRMFATTVMCQSVRPVSRPLFDVAELNVELSGILSISSLSCLLVAWPPKLAMAVSATVLRPTFLFVQI